MAKQSDVKTLSATTLKDNIAPIKVMTKLGMTFINTPVKMMKVSRWQFYIERALTYCLRFYGIHHNVSIY
ncbi:MAG: hypothetical protein ACTJH9_06590 [Pseudoalteromonas sp.]|uniref:hypothetical protein n=1 Tax=unclassified Pseudoalteromonas TaxID=194690 RepID=UPI003F96AB91